MELDRLGLASNQEEGSRLTGLESIGSRVLISVRLCFYGDRVPDATIQLDGLTVFRADRNASLCGKTHGGGLYVYINVEWCWNSVLV